MDTEVKIIHLIIEYYYIKKILATKLLIEIDIEGRAESEGFK